MANWRDLVSFCEAQRQQCLRDKDKSDDRAEHISFHDVVLPMSHRIKVRITFRNTGVLAYSMLCSVIQEDRHPKACKRGEEVVSHMNGQATRGLQASKPRTV
jgi:hypothetical protein